jgi:hypothetical protein
MTKIATRGPISYGLVGYIDDLMAAEGGINWIELIPLAQVEAERRGLKMIQDRRRLEEHARHRRDRDEWHVEMDDKRVFLRMPFTKTWPN